MKRTSGLFFAIVPLVLFITSNVRANEAEGHSDGNEHHANAHHAAVFAGLTTSSIDTEHAHTDFSLGLDYEYRLSFLDRLLGIGAFAEVVFSEPTEYLLGIPFALHPIGGLKALIAPGIAIAKVEEIETRFLLRLGAAYDFHIGIFSITPTVNLDIIESHLSLVYGLAFGVGF